MKKCIKYAICALVVLFAAGCSKAYEDEPGENIRVDIKLDTRADESSDASQPIGNRTYRIVVFNPTTGAKVSEGTYFDNNGEGSSSSLLDPWLTDDKGTMLGTAPDKSAGLHVAAGSYSMIVVSPAWEIETLPERNKYGFHYPRRPEVDLSKRRYVSDLIPVSLTARGEYYDKKYYDCVDLSSREEARLKERRSKIHFEIRGDGVNFTLSKVEFHIQNGAYYDPFNMEYIDRNETNDDRLLLFEGSREFSDASEPLLLPQPLPNPIPEEAKITYSERLEEGKDYLYLLSQRYSLKENGEAVYSVPELILTLARNNDGEVEHAEVKVPLAFDADPHCRYTYNVIVRSTYVTLEVSLDKWTDKKVSGSITEPIRWNPGFPGNLSEWESGETISGKIE